MTGRKRLAAAVATGLCGAGISNGAIITRTVALSGGTVNSPLFGTETYAGFGTPSINATGYTAFAANVSFGGQVSSGNSQNTNAVFSEGSGTVTLVAQQGQQAPSTTGGTPSNASNSGVFNGLNASSNAPTLLNSGAIFDYANLKLSTSGGANDSSGTPITSVNNQAFYTDAGGSLALVLRKNDSTGSTNLTSIAATTLNSPVVNQSGQYATVVTTGNTTTIIGGIVTNASGSTAFVAKGSDAVPGQASGVTFNGSSFTSGPGPSINSTGQVAFRAGITGTGITSTNNVGVFSTSGTGLHAVALAGGQVPGLTTGDFYGTTFSNNPGFNNAGQTAFVDSLAVGGDIISANNVSTGANANNAVVMSEGGGSLHVVAQKGSPAAGITTGAVYSSFGNVVINTAGETAFSASLANTASGAGGVVSGNNSSALYSEGTGVGNLTLVARTFGAAPGTPGDVFGSFGTNFAINGLGEMLFTATLVDNGAVGDVVAGTNASTLYAQDPSGNVQLVARQGFGFQVAPGDIRTISSLGTFSLSGNEDGRVSSWNDSETIPLTLGFTNGTSGVFTAQVTAAVPEPASLAVMAVVGIGAMSRRRRSVAR